MKTSQQEFLLQIREAFGKFPDIPNQICRYASNVVKKNVAEDLVSAFNKQGIETTLEGISQIFRKASSNCNLSPNKLASTLDFNPNDTGEARINALLGELRCINRLNLWGFHNIKPLKAGNNKSADIYCSYGSDNFAVEVFCSPQKKYRYPHHKIKTIDLVSYYEHRAREKKSQLRETASVLSCSKMILCLVFDHLGAQATLTKTDFVEFLKDIASRLNWGREFHFMIITGMVSYEGDDDSIYPELKANRQA